MVNNPPHYGGHVSGIECIDITRHLGFDLGNSVKYVWRAPLKGAELQDLKKSFWYLGDYREHFFGTMLEVPQAAASKLFKVAECELELSRVAEDGRKLAARAEYFSDMARGNVCRAQKSLYSLIKICSPAGDRGV